LPPQHPFELLQGFHFLLEVQRVRTTTTQLNTMN
jgi:hypothetical protein